MGVVVVASRRLCCGHVSKINHVVGILLVFWRGDRQWLHSWAVMLFWVHVTGATLWTQIIWIQFTQERIIVYCSLYCNLFELHINSLTPWSYRILNFKSPLFKHQFSDIPLHFPACFNLFPCEHQTPFLCFYISAPLLKTQETCPGKFSSYVIAL